MSGADRRLEEMKKMTQLRNPAKTQCIRRIQERLKIKTENISYNL